VIAWTGMRGVVTLAAAAGIPLVTATGDAFPGRDAIQVVAFVVTVGTLLIQGLTLPWLIGALRISDPKEEAAREHQRKRGDELARQATIAALTAFRDRQTDEKPRKMAEMMLKRTSLEAQRAAAEPGVAGDDDELQALASEIITARRAALVKARDDRLLDDEVMREMLEQMDFEQAVMENWTPGRFGR
jgi:CPA1 family monovalent cation:H+ antiporter